MHNYNRNYTYILPAVLLIATVWAITAIVMGTQAILASNVIMPDNAVSDSPQKAAIREAIEKLTTQTVITSEVIPESDQ